MPRATLPLILFFAVGVAWGEVTPERPRVEDTADTLHAREWKLGLTTSSYGIAEALQLDSALFLDLGGLLNAGVKARIYKDPSVAVAVEAFGGYWVPGPFVHAGLYEVGAKAELSLTLAPRWLLHAVVGGYSFGGHLQLGTRPYVGQLTYLDVRGVLEFDVTPRHLLFLTVGTPSSFIASLGAAAQSFDAQDFFAVLVGYQLSLSRFNLRLDAGYGPGVLGRGLAVALDAYFRF